jgi:uncharacterized protein
MTQPAKSQEPSMEEILASIRRIIADDDATKSAQRAPEAPKPAAPPTTPSRPLAPTPSAVPPEPSVAELAPSPAPAMTDPAPASEPAPAEQSTDILDLTESMASPPPAEPEATSMSGAMPQFRTIDGGSDVGFDEAAEKAPSYPPVERREYRTPERVQLISNETSAAVDSAFNALAQTVLVQNARTLEDLVREMLRPMLKAWLDDNLPNVVERLVRTEIERVSRGRMG